MNPTSGTAMSVGSQEESCGFTAPGYLKRTRTVVHFTVPPA
jgi:hypothetical protein